MFEFNRLVPIWLKLGVVTGEAIVDKAAGIRANSAKLRTVAFYICRKPPPHEGGN